MRYISVCSGIEAASVAWKRLGWKPVAFAEVEAFPSAVLKHRFPDVPNLGDITKVDWKQFRGKADLVVGGTPCQGFSIAGMRGGLLDERSNLCLTFVRLADEINAKYILWENVPGVLSMRDNAFGNFLGALAGEDEALVPSGQRWTDAGCVYGPKRAIAWRVLDAQYFGVAQRRRRVFVVGVLREAGGGDPAEILFEWDRLRRDSPPSRKKEEETTQIAGTLSTNGGGTTRPAGNANELDFCVLNERIAHSLLASSNGNIKEPDKQDYVITPTQDVARFLVTKTRLDFETETFVCHHHEES